MNHRPGTSSTAAMAEQLRALLIRHGLAPDEADACLSIAVSEIAQSRQHNDNHDAARVSICHRIAHHLTMLQISSKNSPEDFKRKFEHNYLIISGALAAGVFEGFKTLADSTYGIVSSLAKLFASGSVNQTRGVPDLLREMARGKTMMAPFPSSIFEIAAHERLCLVEANVGRNYGTLRKGAKMTFCQWLLTRMVSEEGVEYAVIEFNKNSLAIWVGSSFDGHNVLYGIISKGALLEAVRASTSKSQPPDSTET